MSDSRDSPYIPVRFSKMVFSREAGSRRKFFGLGSRYGGAQSLVVCAMVVLSSTPLARAEKATSEPEIVIEGTRSSSDAERDHASSLAISSVGSEQVRSEAPQSLADALRRGSPSVSVQQTTPGQGTISVRGLSGRAVIYAVDGVRVNMAFFRAGNNDYLGLVDPLALQSISVVPVATSVEFGSDALGGTVLMRTSLPGYRLDPLTRFQAFQSFGSNPLASTSRVALTHEAANFGAQVGFTYIRAGAVRPGRGMLSPDPGSYVGLERTAGAAYTPVYEDVQRGTEFDWNAGDAVLSKRIASGTDLILRGQHAVRPELVRYDQVTPRFLGAFPARAERNLRPMTRSMASLALVKRSPGGLIDHLESLLSWQRIFERRLDRRLEEVCVEPTAEPPLEPESCTGRLRLVAANQRALEENSSNRFSLKVVLRKATPDRGVSVVAGVDAHHDRVSSSAESIDLWSQTRTADSPRYPDGSALSEVGGFVHTRLRVARDLELSVGARASAFSTNIRARSAPLASPAVRNTLFDAVGSAGLRWEFAPGIAWVANGARGVRAPNVEDYAALGARARGRFQVPNDDLGPEHSYTADSGLKLRRGPHTAQMALFYTWYADAIALAPTQVGGANANEEGDAYFHSVNASSVELYGIETMISVELAEPVELFGRALAMLGTQRNPAETGLPAETPADRVPPIQGELGLRLRPLVALELETFAAARQKQDRLNDPINIEDNRIPPGGTPGYVTFHARARYTVKPSVIARLAIDNITDELVLEHGSGFYRPGFGVTASLELATDAE